MIRSCGVIVFKVEWVLASYPSPLFSQGKWKSEGPGIHCMRMHSSPSIKGICYTFGHVRYINRNKHYIIVILRAESVAPVLLLLLFSALDSTHLTLRSILCKLFMKEVMCLCRYQLVRRKRVFTIKVSCLAFCF